MSRSLKAISLLLCSVAINGFEFSDKLTGWYAGEPTTAPIGPMKGIPMIWSIQPVDKERGIWLMEDIFLDGMIMGSHQQFLVTPTMVTYCGLLRHFMSNDVSKPAAVLNDYLWQSDTSNSTQMVWCAYDQAGGCSTFQWKFIIISSNSSHVESFRIQVMFPPAVHADVTFTFQGENPTGGYPQGVDYADRKACQLINSGRYNYGWNSAEYPHYNSLGKNIPPAEIQKLLKQQQNIKPKGSLDLVRKPSSSSSYKFCYLINNQTDFKLQWNFDNRTKEVSMKVSAKTDGWASIGFYPLFPGMKHASILLGSEKCGVSAMKAVEWVGTPVPSNWTTIRSPSVTSANGILSFSLKFTKPPQPQWRSNCEVMFAVGKDGNQCDSPSYHDNLRGQVSIPDLAMPEISLNPYMKC